MKISILALLLISVFSPVTHAFADETIDIVATGKSNEGGRMVIKSDGSEIEFYEGDEPGHRTVSVAAAEQSSQDLYQTTVMGVTLHVFKVSAKEISPSMIAVDLNYLHSIGFTGVHRQDKKLFLFNDGSGFKLLDSDGKTVVHKMIMNVGGTGVESLTIE